MSKTQLPIEQWLEYGPNAGFDWHAAARRKGQPKARGASETDMNLPLQTTPTPAGVIKHLTPTPHERAILQRIARGFLIVTQLEERTIYTYEDGTPIVNERTFKPLDNKGFARLSRFLDPEPSSGLFNIPGAAQRWNARKPPTSD